MSSRFRLALILFVLLYPWAVSTFVLHYWSDSRVVAGCPAPPSSSPQASTVPRIDFFPHDPVEPSHSTLPDPGSDPLDGARALLPNVAIRPPASVTYENELRYSTPQIARLFLRKGKERESLKGLVGNKSIAVLHFWATWCQPCLKELPYISALWQEARKKGHVEVAVISEDTDPAAARQYAAEHGLSFPLYEDPSSILKEGLLGNASKALPTTVAISKEGRIEFVVLGSLGQDSALILEREIRSALQRAGQR